VLLQRGEVLFGELPALGIQMHRDRGAEHGATEEGGEDGCAGVGGSDWVDL
jgi:hypothetical protein